MEGFPADELSGSPCGPASYELTPIKNDRNNPLVSLNLLPDEHLNSTLSAENLSNYNVDFTTMAALPGYCNHDPVLHAEDSTELLQEQNYLKDHQRLVAQVTLC